MRKQIDASPAMCVWQCCLCLAKHVQAKLLNHWFTLQLLAVHDYNNKALHVPCYCYWSVLHACISYHSTVQSLLVCRHVVISSFKF